MNASLPNSGLAPPAQSLSLRQAEQQRLSFDSLGPRETSQDRDVSIIDNGRIEVRESEVTCASDAHWAAVIDSIAELRNELRDEDLPASSADGSVQSLDTPCPRLFYGCNSQEVDLESILEYLPPRIVVDRSIARFFNTLDATAGRLNITLPYLFALTHWEQVAFTAASSSERYGPFDKSSLAFLPGSSPCLNKSTDIKIFSTMIFGEVLMLYNLGG